MRRFEDILLDDVDDTESQAGEEAPVGGTEKPLIRIMPLHSSLDVESALLATRMVDGGRWHARLLQRGFPTDPDVFTLLGFEHGGSPVTTDMLRHVLTRQRQRLERRKAPRADLLGRNINRLGDLLHLSAIERAVLRVAVITGQTSRFADLYRCASVRPRDLVAAFGYAMGQPVHAIKHCFRNGSSLSRLGLFAGGSKPYGGNCSMEMDDALVDALLSTQFDVKRFLRSLARPAPASRLTMDDFTHIAARDVVLRYLGEAVHRRRVGVNILLYGAPGTGKTEFSRALAESLQIDLHEVPNEDRDGDPISGGRRFKAFTMCQSILATNRQQLLLFDEVEDVFGSIGGSSELLFGMGQFGGRAADSLRKSWVNETLETNPVPAVWTCNSIEAIDPAYLRRFDLTVEFLAPSRSVRKRVIDRYFRVGEISSQCAERLAGIETLVPAQVERAARVVRSLRSRDINRRDAEIEQVVSSSLRAMGHRMSLAAPGLPEHYDEAFLNTDRDLNKLAIGLTHGVGARLCLYGPPGTGKTAFAHHLGRRLDRPLHVKRGSDLQSMYLGETEKNIAEAFRQAREEGAILLIDEADGFLRDRTGAQRSWEVSQVNELLTQMEAFIGIFVASTNLIDTLDAASLRRFDFKVKFGYLTREQRRLMLQRIVASSSAEDVGSAQALAALDRLEYLAAGDYANALRQLRVTDEEPTSVRLVQLLSAEAMMKPEAKHRSIGFH
jgi:transitional endoplasmic reticulum ATPase